MQSSRDKRVSENFMYKDRSSLQLQLHSEVLRARASTYKFWGIQFRLLQLALFISARYDSIHSI